ncbi:MAG: ATP-binding protein [Deltaproteobacteria bacterium]|nr:ATP-binding protein [Deltaproteobacteria bacterium]
MRELSLHILDIAENGIDAGAGLMNISILEDKEKNALTITLEDDGRGIEKGALEKVVDPFYTTKRTRRVGLGLSLFRETARRCEGTFSITSQEGQGTRVTATFRLDHIDLPPLGNMAGCIIALIAGHPEVELVYTHRINHEKFYFDTRDLKKELDDVAINEPKVLKYLGEVIRESEAKLRAVA